MRKGTLAVLMMVAMGGISVTGCSSAATSQNMPETTKAGQETSQTAAPTSETAADTKKEGGTETSGEDIRIGVTLTITGANAPAGRTFLQGIEAVVDEVNAAGGIKGRNIILEVEDAGDDTDKALNAVNLMVEREYSAILGPHWSSQVYAVKSSYENSKIPAIVGGTNYKLPDPENNYLFLGRPSDQIQASALANYIVDNTEAKKVGVLYSSDDFGQGAYEVVKSTFEENNLDFTAETHNTTDTDYSSTLLKMQAAGCDVLLIWTSENPMTIIARQISELGLNENMEFFCSPCIGGSVVQDAVDHVWLKGFYSVQETIYDDTDPEVKAFGEAYNAKYGQYPDAAARQYAKIAYILVDALERAEDPANPESVKLALEQTTSLETIFGTVTCDENHSLNHVVYITRWDSDVDGLVYLLSVEG